MFYPCFLLECLLAVRPSSLLSKALEACLQQGTYWQPCTLIFIYFSKEVHKGTQRAGTSTIFFSVLLQLQTYLTCFLAGMAVLQRFKLCCGRQPEAGGCAWNEPYISSNFRWVAVCDSYDSAQGAFGSRFASLEFFGNCAPSLLVSWEHFETYRYMEADGHFKTQVLQFQNHQKEWMLNTFSKLFDSQRSLVSCWWTSAKITWNEW